MLLSLNCRQMFRNKKLNSKIGRSRPNMSTEKRTLFYHLVKALPSCALFKVVVLLVSASTLCLGFGWIDFAGPAICKSGENDGD